MHSRQAAGECRHAVEVGWTASTRLLEICHACASRSCAAKDACQCSEAKLATHSYGNQPGGATSQQRRTQVSLGAFGQALFWPLLGAYERLRLRRKSGRECQYVCRRRNERNRHGYGSWLSTTTRNTIKR